MKETKIIQKEKLRKVKSQLMIAQDELIVLCNHAGDSIYDYMEILTETTKAISLVNTEIKEIEKTEGLMGVVNECAKSVEERKARREE